MAYRKIGIRASISVELLNELVKECKEKYLASSASAHLKQIAKDITPVFYIVKNKQWKFYGAAQAIGVYAKKCLAKRILKLKRETHPTTRILGDDYFMVITINLGLIRKITRRGLKYIVAHEFAHLIQIAHDEEVEGQSSFSTDNDHNRFWKVQCKRCGGDGEEFIWYRHVWC